MKFLRAILLSWFIAITAFGGAAIIQPPIPPGVLIIEGTPEPLSSVVRNSGNTGYEHQYAPGAITSFVALTEYYPMKLVSYSTGLWYAATHIYPYQTNYPAFGLTNVYPIPGVHSPWVQFARNGNDGPTGSTGSPGVNGANGVGNINYSVWSSTVGYSSNTPTVVSYAGQWYDLIAATSSNEPPTSYTNVWAISVSKGTGGTILGTNIVLRGNYDAGYTYTTNDGVSYNGSSFYIGPTNVALGAGNAPSGSQPPANSAMWTVLASIGNQGPQGAQGNDGADGNVITNINNYQTIISTGVVYITDGTTTVTPQTVYYRNGTNFGIVSWNPTTSVAIVEIKTNFGAGVVVAAGTGSISVAATTNSGVTTFTVDGPGPSAGGGSPYTETVTAQIMPTNGGNSVTGSYAGVGSGEGNRIYGSVGHTHGRIGGGKENVLGENGQYSGICFGLQNLEYNATQSGIGWGEGNRINSGTSWGGIVCGVGNILNPFNLGQEASFIGGGWRNLIDGEYSVICGGFGNSNRNQKSYSFIGGGVRHIIANHYATIPGGYECVATGLTSFAAGTHAEAVHDGAFVWADYYQTYTGAVFRSTANNQFLIRAAGGVGIGTNAPAQALDVNGNVKVSGSVTNGFFFPLGDYLRSDGTNLFFVNSTGGVAQITSM
jgi:hypothetical protein